MNTGIIALIAGVLWAAFIVVWLIAAFTSKRTIQRSYSSWVFRLVMVIIAIVFISQNKGAVRSIAWLQPTADPALDILGLALLVIGIGIAFWARWYLARNWGMPMTVKEGAELVTGGPYEYIRNPIYTGIILAMIGSGWALGLWWFLVAIGALVYFTYASLQEEKIMLKMFPSTYPAYQARTKMLIPFIF